MQSTADTYYYRANDHLRNAEYTKSISWFQKAGKLYEIENDMASYFLTKNKISHCYFQMGYYNEALQQGKTTLQQAEKSLADTARNKLFIADGYNNLGVFYGAKGNHYQQLKHYTKALALYQQHLKVDDPQIATCYNNIGIVYSKLGDYNKAIEYQYKGLNLRLQIFGEEHADIALSYNNLGSHCLKMGDYVLAQKHYVKALGIWQKTLPAKHPHLARGHNNVGIIYYHQHNYFQALEHYQQAFNLWKSTLGERHPNIAKVYINIGKVYRHLYEYRFALLYFKQAIEIWEGKQGTKHPEIANIYIHIAKCYFQECDYENAAKQYQQAIKSLFFSYNTLDIHDNPPLKNYSSPTLLLEALAGKAKCLVQLYHQQNAIATLLAAHNTYCVASDLIDQIRHSYSAEDSKLNLAQQVKGIYEAAITCCYILTNSTASKPNSDFYYKELAFKYSEKSKGLLLFSALKDTEAKMHANISSTLLTQVRQLQTELAYLDNRIVQEKYKEETQRNTTQLQQWQNQHFDYKRAYEQLIRHLEQQYPQYYHLKYGIEVSGVMELQQFLAKNHPNSQLISYFVGESALYVFTFCKQYYQMLQLPCPANFSDLIDSFRESITDLSRKRYIKLGQDLYKILLPFLKQTTANHLYILPDAELNTLPFEALLNVSSALSTPYIKLPYLINCYSISYHYSATLLQHTYNNHQRTVQLADSYVGFAPVYKPNISIRSNNLLNSESLPINKSRPMRDVRLDGKRYPALIHSEQEVKTIQTHFVAQNYLSKVFTHSTASKYNFEQHIANYKYIHIAAHHVYNVKKPEVSGILFSVDKANPQQAILYISDAYHLQLNANLVVLSCCDSGKGKLARGEGMMAINRGFLYAGAANVIFTLFKVYDKASCYLTQHLFQHIIGTQQTATCTYAQALQKAKLQMIQSASPPKSWCGFVLIGA